MGRVDEAGHLRVGVGEVHLHLAAADGDAGAHADVFGAVAVVVEDGGNAGSEATGGALSAPIARDVMRAVIGA